MHWDGACRELCIALPGLLHRRTPRDLDQFFLDKKELLKACEKIKWEKSWASMCCKEFVVLFFVLSLAACEKVSK